MFAVTILPLLDTFFHQQCAQSLYSHRLPNGHEIARAHIPHPDHLQSELNSNIRVKEIMIGAEAEIKVNETMDYKMY